VSSGVRREAEPAVVRAEDEVVVPKNDARSRGTTYRRSMTRRSWAFDAAVVAVVLVLGQLEAWWGVLATHRQGPVWAQALLYALTALLLLGRRVAPLGTLAAIVLVSVVEFAAVGSPEGNGVALAGCIAGYSVARWERKYSPWWGLPLVAVLWAGWVAFDPVDQTWSQRRLALVWLSPWVIAWLAGALVRATSQAAEQRRVVREQRASRAVAEERNRIARELHDVIGHSVSVMTVQASAVRRRLHPDQEVERQALETVESVGREALAEMRMMVGVLRGADGGPDREPPPRLDELRHLLAKFRDSGLDVDLDVTGEPRPLAPGLDLTAYRLVQEGLTNTLRHAVRPGRAVVSIAYADDRLELSVRDDGAPVAAPEAGHGLLGLRERVAVYGGDLVARPGRDGGFELVATLPLEPA
jgi:signal transduction histidine kinase